MAKSIVHVARQFRRANRAVAAIEFAIGATVLFAFIFGIINLGFLALTENGLQNGVANAARVASADASDILSTVANGGTPSATCPDQGTPSTVQQAFNAGGAPPFSASNAPSVTVQWFGPTSGLPTGCTSQNPSAPYNYVTVSVTYHWVPVALPYLFNNGIALAASDTEPVMSPATNVGNTS